MRHKSIVLLAVLSSIAFPRASSEGVCEIRQTKPRKNSPPLRFCSWYHSTSCCLPAHDADMNNKFLAFIEAGPTCEKYLNKAKLYLAMAFCYGCDPEQATHFTEPINTAFFNASKTVKICRSVADNMAPILFSDCGLLLPDDRELSCSPNSAIVPELVWPDCDHGKYVCKDPENNWYCSDEPCGFDNTPLGFTGGRCNVDDLTCSGTMMMLNDNRAAKPPYFESYPVEIVDEARCIEQTKNASQCRCLRPPIDAAAVSIDRYLVWVIPLVTAIMTTL